MSAITWLHISDLQFCTSPTHDVDAVLQALLRDVEKRIEWYNLRPDFIAITGDIAHSGKPPEYELARQFFDELLYTTGLNKSRLFLVPGNHDVDRALISQGARNIGDSLTDGENATAILDDPGDRQLMFARFGGYAAFVNDYLGDYLPFDQDHYFYARTLKLLERRVALLGLNSAWLSTSEQDGAMGLVIGARQVQGALEQSANVDLRIALIHHPFDWLREFDREDVEPMLSDGCDFILHGHTHQTSVLSLKGPETQAMVIASGACRDTQCYPNSYNFVQLDLAADTGSVHLRRYSDERGGFWTRDTLTYRNTSTGRLSFQFGITEPEVRLRILKPGDQIRNGQYRIMKRIHEGGMATVWLAEQPEFGRRKVAIKEPKLDREQRQELARRFRQEVDLAPQLERLPHVVRAYTLEHRSDGTPLLVMEYVDGGSLTDLIVKNPDGLPIGQALKITEDVLLALAGLHQFPDSPVHRDVKPSNILLDHQRGALLSDFGLTQLPGKSRRSQSLAKSHPGTPLYMAPEQEQTTTLLTPAADLYALGCVLYEMLTGKQYRRLTPGTRAAKIRPDVPEWLDEVLAKALSENTWDRYQSAEEMAEALEPPISWLPGHVLDDKYQVAALIITTGKCEIYQAHQLLHARQTVAIKRLKPDRLLEQEGVEPKEAHERFEREISILRHIEDEHVLRLLDDGGRTENGDRYFVTQLADKGSLRDYLQTKPGNRLNPIEALDISIATCQAIATIHRLGIIHRDIKPGNIFLFSRPDGYAVKLADFSIAKVPKTWFVHDTITQMDVFLGTYRYSAPEQFASELNDPRSDLYAWAAVFFEMLTGESLVQNLTGESDGVSFMALLQYYRTGRDDELPAPFFADRGIPQEIIPLMQKALRKERESRYQSAEEVQEDLIRVRKMLTEPDPKAMMPNRLEVKQWENDELQAAIERLHEISPAEAEFGEAQAALAIIYDELGNRSFRRLRFIQAIKDWSETDRIQRGIEGYLFKK
jgi:serine/threonine protein kinase/predicted MPP superfamily phosphohydrolase